MTKRGERGAVKTRESGFWEETCEAKVRVCGSVGDVDWNFPDVMRQCASAACRVRGGDADADSAENFRERVSNCEYCVFFIIIRLS